MYKNYENKKFIVTGVAGFIGSHCTEALLSSGAQVVGLDNFSSGLKENMIRFIDNENFTLINVDIGEWSEVSKFFSYFEGAEGIFHFAAKARIQPSLKTPSETHKSNVDGTFNILEMARIAGVDKFVYSASSSSYGLKSKLPCVETSEVDCLNPYALTKFVGEHYAKVWGKSYGIKNVCLKYFNVYGERSQLSGPYAPVIGLFFKQALNSGRLTIVGDGEQRRDFTYVEDVVRANILAMENIDKANGETINIGTGTNYSINEVADMVISSMAALGVPVVTENVPPRPAEARETLANIDKAKDLLGWTPKTHLTEIINRLAGYYKKQFNPTLTVPPDRPLHY